MALVMRRLGVGDAPSDLHQIYTWFTPPVRREALVMRRLGVGDARPDLHLIYT
jgi:hypothetical protein